MRGEKAQAPVRWHGIKFLGIHGIMSSNKGIIRD